MSVFQFFQRQNARKESTKPAQIVPEPTTTTGEAAADCGEVVRVRLVHAGKIMLEYFDMDGFLGKGGIVLMFLKGKQLHHVPYPYLGEQREEWMRREVDLVNAGLPATLPVLWHNDVPLGEATTILRFLAKKLGEYGADHMRDAYADMLVESLDCWRAELSLGIAGCMKNEHVNLAKSGFWEARVVYLDCLERMLRVQMEKVAGGPFTFGATPSWVDFFVWGNLWDDFRIRQELRAWAQAQIKMAKVEVRHLKICHAAGIFTRSATCLAAV